MLESDETFYSLGLFSEKYKYISIEDDLIEEQLEKLHTDAIIKMRFVLSA